MINNKEKFDVESQAIAKFDDRSEQAEEKSESDLDEVPVRGDIIVEQMTSRSDSLSSLSQRGGEKINIFMDVSSSQSSDTEGYPQKKSDFAASSNKKSLRPKYEPKITQVIKP